jgi:hypothetical protein
MQWINIYELQMHEPVKSSQEWQNIQAQLREAIEVIVWMRLHSYSLEYVPIALAKTAGCFFRLD